VTPGARIEATIELLEEIVSRAERPADLTANAYFRNRRFIGSGDRRAVSERVWDILRRRGQLGWWLARTGVRKPTPRALVAAHLILAERNALADLDALFDGGRHRPMTFDEAEYAVLRALDGHTLDHPEQPDWVAANVPEWIAPHLAESYGPDWPREIAALETPAPVDLRVNRLKANTERARGMLAKAGVDTEPTPFARDGLRLARRLSIVTSPAFEDGLVEIQDEGSQLVAALVDAKPGMQVVDYCAGAGGKTLAMAAGMENKGRIVALDVLETRLDRSAQRLRRAGVHNVERRTLDEESRKWLKRRGGAFDRVLVDAPCTGTGTWRRNPDGRWSLQPVDLEELVPKQAAILDAAQRLVKPGGRLVYATCSVLAPENERQAEAFLSRHPDFEAVPVGTLLGEVLREGATLSLPEGPWLRLSPRQHGTDGFFAAVFQRRGEAAAEPEIAA